MYLLGLSRKHHLSLESLHDSLLTARKHGRVKCGEIEIQDRHHDERSSTYMFSMNNETLAQANIQVDSIRKLMRLPEEYSNFLEMDKETDDSNRPKMPTQIGGFKIWTKGTILSSTHREEIRG